jgi:hypothetical protein
VLEGLLKYPQPPPEQPLVALAEDVYIEVLPGHRLYYRQYVYLLLNFHRRPPSPGNSAGSVPGNYSYGFVYGSSAYPGYGISVY